MNSCIVTHINSLKNSSLRFLKFLKRNSRLPGTHAKLVDSSEANNNYSYYSGSIQQQINIYYVMYSDLSYISGHCSGLCTAAVELQEALEQDYKMFVLNSVLVVTNGAVVLSHTQS